MTLVLKEAFRKENGSFDLTPLKACLKDKDNDCGLHITVQYCTFLLLSPVEVGMKSLSFTEFRKKASEILSLVEKGETVRVLRHGKAIAKIIPAETGEKTPSWKRPGLRLVKPGASLSKAILEERRKSR